MPATAQKVVEGQGFDSLEGQTVYLHEGAKDTDSTIVKGGAFRLENQSTEVDYARITLSGQRMVAAFWISPGDHVRLTDMGKQGTLISDIKAAGFQVLLVPVAVCAGTLVFAALAGLVLPLGIKDSMAAASGMGWYSLAPTLLAPYSLTVSATAFLSNIMHELFSIVAVPVVAKKLGYIEAVALPGATAMDTVLPVVVSATCDRMAIYSFASGVILSLSVPVLIPAIIALPF